MFSLNKFKTTTCTCISIQLVSYCITCLERTSLPLHFELLSPSLQCTLECIQKYLVTQVCKVHNIVTDHITGRFYVGIPYIVTPSPRFITADPIELHVFESTIFHSFVVGRIAPMNSRQDLRPNYSCIWYLIRKPM